MFMLDSPDDEDRIIAARAAENDGWPFGHDATRDDPLTAHRIAVTDSYPSWAYIVAFDRESPARPTEEETRMLVSFLDQYKDYWYNESYLKRLAARPLDVDGGANTVIFHKFGDRDWGYRRSSFTMGFLWTIPWPGSLRDEERAKHPDSRYIGPLALDELMDVIHARGSAEPDKRWAAWKAEHPDAFPAANGTAA